MKKIISLILVVTLIFGLVPAASAASNSAEETYIEVTSDNAPLRAGPGKSHDTVATLEKGDCLVMIGYCENRWGNIWYKCQYAGSEDTVYLYADHAEFHTHSYGTITNDLSVCACGAYKLDTNSGTTQTNAALLTAGTLLSAEAVAGLSTLGTTVLTGLNVAFPYVAVVSIGGMLIYMAVSRSGSQVKDVVKIESAIDVMDMISEMDDPEVYFAAAFTFGSNPALLLVSQGMDLDDATDYMTKVVNDPLNAFVSSVGNKSMLNMWTPLRDSAELLCQNFIAKNTSFTYGNSNKSIGEAEHDKTYKSYKIYFEHFHLFRVSNPFSLTKVRDIHVLFGGPLDLKPTA